MTKDQQKMKQSAWQKIMNVNELIVVHASGNIFMRKLRSQSRSTGWFYFFLSTFNELRFLVMRF